MIDNLMSLPHFIVSISPTMRQSGIFGSTTIMTYADRFHDFNVYIVNNEFIKFQIAKKRILSLWPVPTYYERKEEFTNSEFMSLFDDSPETLKGVLFKFRDDYNKLCREQIEKEKEVKPTINPLKKRFDSVFK